MDNILFTPLQIGCLDVKNRIIMAPLTRSRANAEGIPSQLAVKYYEQRASGGLLISEGVNISPMGRGYANTPGIYSKLQIQGWRSVTDAVHAKGGRIALQLWHVGRVSHSSLLPDGAQPVSSSALRASTQTYTETGKVDTTTPRSLSLVEIEDTVRDYAIAARNAIVAGFDLVEVHAANGYLIDQFLRDGANNRTDSYGGSIENRIRFLKEVVSAVVDEIGANKVGVRLSPLVASNDMTDSDPRSTFLAAVSVLKPFGIAYLHVREDYDDSIREEEASSILAAVRSEWGKRVYIVNGGYTGKTAERAVTNGHADAVAFGRDYIANPDLPERIRSGAPLNVGRIETFYGGEAEGYIDYPAIVEL